MKINKLKELVLILVAIILVVFLIKYLNISKNSILYAKYAVNTLFCFINFLLCLPQEAPYPSHLPRCFVD